ncbi:hypothetical protein ACEPAG_7943 [Sanghuangporus baumii]
MLFTALSGCLLLVVAWLVYTLFIQPLFSPLRNLPGPDARKGIIGLGGHLNLVLNASLSKITHEDFVAAYGRNVRIKGLGNFEDRLLSTDPAVLSYVLNHSNEYQKPWQSRRVIARLIGEGLLASEGEMHKRMRRVSSPAFSSHNLSDLMHIAMNKAYELRDKWFTMIDEPHAGIEERVDNTTKIDVCHWISRSAFDVIGLAGFNYDFSAIQNEENKLFLAYRNMFEIVVSRGETLWDIVCIYFPWLELLFPNEKTRMVQKSQNIINSIGGQLIEERKRRLADNGKQNETGRRNSDILSLLIKSNFSSETPPSQRLSDEEVLANVNTYFFAGSDTTSLTLTWVLYLLAMHSEVQDRLRAELYTLPKEISRMPMVNENGDWRHLWKDIDELPYLNNVVRETLRLISPLHSSIRVAMKDDEIPTSDAIKMRDRSVHHGIKIKKGQFVHIPVESMNLDKTVWGEDAWNFNPDRWDNLPDAVLEQPGLYNHTLSFSAGPRSCIGMRFSLTVIKDFLYVLLCNFAFAPAKDDRVYAKNAVLMRPYVSGKFMEGSQCPLMVTRV